MNGFSVPAIKVMTADGHNFTLLESFTYMAKDGTVIEVPEGTRSDGASTPQAGWATLPPFGRYWLAAFFHDHLYRDTQIPKDRCDSLFLEAMESIGVPPFERDVIYQGVHLGGWKAFRDDRAPLPPA